MAQLSPCPRNSGPATRRQSESVPSSPFRRLEHNSLNSEFWLMSRDYTSLSGRDCCCLLRVFVKGDDGLRFEDLLNCFVGFTRCSG